ncbi:hypothetical protein D9M68_951390 [compost metagenome]
MPWVSVTRWPLSQAITATSCRYSCARPGKDAGAGRAVPEGAAVSQSLATATSWPSENLRASWNAVYQAWAISASQTTNRTPNVQPSR